MLEHGTHDIPAGKLAVVVTYLEMTSRVATKDIAAPQGVTFQRIKPTLEEYRDLFQRVGAHDWLWYGRLRLNDTELQALLDDPNRPIYTLAKDGCPEALLELDFTTTGECELAYFGLTPRLIGSGAGRYLMNQAIAIAWDAGVQRFHLHTCTHDSPQALEFYLRSGFAVYKRRVDIDDDPRLLGLLPKGAAPRIAIL
ncbi:MAG: GNAT family N-acetyltransferase [Sulfitobacter sp.]